MSIDRHFRTNIPQFDKISFDFDAFEIVCADNPRWNEKDDRSVSLHITDVVQTETYEFKTDGETFYYIELIIIDKSRPRIKIEFQNEDIRDIVKSKVAVMNVLFSRRQT